MYQSVTRKFAGAYKYKYKFFIGQYEKVVSKRSGFCFDRNEP